MTTTPKPDAGGHTPEPWSWRDVSGAGIQISATLPVGFKFDATHYGADGTKAFMVFTMHDSGHVTVSSARWVQFETAPWKVMQEANAARIVACVNAMAGIADPATLRAQRDDLLAALKSIRGIIHDDLTHAQQQHHAEAINFADLVLRKAGGVA